MFFDWLTAALFCGGKEEAELKVNHSNMAPYHFLANQVLSSV